MSVQTRMQILASADQSWRTPPALFAALDAEFHFTLDAAADDANHLCDAYFTEERSALTQDWVQADGTPHRVFINPPYGKDSRGQSLQGPFWYQAQRQMFEHDVTSVLLVPPRTSTAWWNDCLPWADELRFIRGRVPFLLADGTPVRNNTTDSVLVIFRGGDGLHGIVTGTFMELPPTLKRRRRRGG